MMEDEQHLIRATIQRIVKSYEDPVRRGNITWDPDLWRALAEAGMTGVGPSESVGSSGGSVKDAVAIVRILASNMAALPVAEHLLVAAPAMSIGGMPLPSLDQPLTIALAGVSATKEADSWIFSGISADVPWATVSHAIAVVADSSVGASLAIVPTEEVSVTSQTNIADEPRDSVRFDCVPASSVAQLTTAQVEELQACFAICRAVQLSAALDQILKWSAQYVGERHQFGRALAQFQAIQMNLAIMAGEVAAVDALVSAAVRALDSGSDKLLLAAAAAKVRAGAAVEVVARIAHQVHGAIGFTEEFHLHYLTKRCWSWRDEGGGERMWSQVLGSGLFCEGGDLWPVITNVL